MLLLSVGLCVLSAGADAQRRRVEADPFCPVLQRLIGAAKEGAVPTWQSVAPGKVPAVYPPGFDHTGFNKCSISSNPGPDGRSPRFEYMCAMEYSSAAEGGARYAALVRQVGTCLAGAPMTSSQDRHERARFAASAEPKVDVEVGGDSYPPSRYDLLLIVRRSTSF